MFDASGQFSQLLGSTSCILVWVHVSYPMTVPKIVGDSIEEHRATTRERVFEAFATLLAHSTYSQITMADLAAEAGLGRSALYNHFKDKEAVVLEFAADETDRYAGQLSRQLAAVNSPTERLRTYVTHHVETQTEFHLGLGPELSAMLSPDSRRAMREHASVVESLLRQIISDGVALGEFAVTDVDSVLSLVHATLQARRASAEATIDFVLRAVVVSDLA